MMQVRCWEMFKLGCEELHECLLEIYNGMLLAESLEPSWHITATYSFQDAT